MSRQATWRADLDALHDQVTTRVTQPADWEESRERARNVTVAAAMMQAVASMSDELHDAAIDDLPSEIADALHRFAPGFDLSLLDTYPKAALDGLTNALKGALFELRVVDGIDAGTIPIPDGADGFRLVQDFATPGYDAQLLDAHGHVISLVQLKTSSSDHIIREALRKYPDIDHFMASHEAAATAASHGIAHVADTGISDAALTHEVAGALADQTTTGIGEVFDEIVPQFTYAIIVAQSAFKLYKGDDVADVIAWGRQRAQTATVTSTIAGLASMATGTDAVRIPTVLVIYMAKGLVAEIDRSASAIRDFGSVVDQLGN